MEINITANSIKKQKTCYSLSGFFHAHDQDIKDLVHISNTLIATVSRDQCLKIWNVSNPQNILLVHCIVNPHESYINSIALIRPFSNDHPQLIASGGSDHQIRIWNPTSEHVSIPVHILTGHSHNVCVLGHVPGLVMGLISGSWDKSARVWADGQCLFNLLGHTQAVWGVLAFDQHSFVTASADRSIKFWSGEKCVKTIESAHDDVVRALTNLPTAEMFASSSNDTVIKLWRLSGDPVYVLHGHSAYIYKVVTNMVTNELVSCSEDQTVRIWQDSDLLQTVRLPATTVWSVSVSPSGTDFAACTSDGMVYLFTRNTERHAPADVLAKYHKSLVASQSTQIGDLDKDKLPGPEVLLENGASEGQVLMVRTKVGGVEAHEWSFKNGGQWTKIGDVVDAVASQRKTKLNGIDYDYVFDIDVGGEPVVMLKLPYNISDNPYDVAQNFITRNQLSQNYIEDIVQFIVKNTDGQPLGCATASKNAFEHGDPLTGSKRYTPDPNTSTTTFESAIASNPWTSGYTPQTSSGAMQNPNSIVPIRDMVTFKQINYAAIKEKIMAQQTEFGIILDGMSHADLDIESHPWPVAQEILDHPSWPADQKFPALDLLRHYVVTHELIGEQLEQIWTWIHSFSIRNGPIDLLSIRMLVNLFHLEMNRAFVVSHMEPLLVLANELRTSSNKHIRLGVATLLLNMSIHAAQSRSCTNAMNIIAVLVEIAPVETDLETLYRTVTALGTISSLGTTIRPYINGLSVKSVLESLLQKKELEMRTRDAIKDSIAILS